MITYFILVFFVGVLTGARSIAIDLSEMIRDGSINNFILKPIGFFRYHFTMFFADKIVYLINILIPFIFFIIVMKSYLFFYPERIICFIISTILSIALNFMIYFIFGLITVWIEEISSLLDLWRNISFLLAGGAFPLSMLPTQVYQIFSLLHFKYMLFTPISFYLDDLSPKELFFQLGIQSMWILILGIVIRFIWKKAMNDFSGYGIYEEV